MKRSSTSPPPFENLVNQYSEEIFAYLWRLFMGSTQEAEDGLQETYLRAFRAYPKLKHHSNLRAWLYKIATNVANTELSRRTLEIPLVGEEVIHPAGDAGIEVLVEQRISVEQVTTAVAKLPHKQRIALVMRKYHGFDYGEIARLLEITEGAARANVYQAVRRLRSEFHPEEIGEAGGHR